MAKRISDRPSVRALGSRFAPLIKFPSGHAAAATLFYGFVAVLLARDASTWSRKVSFVAVAAMLIVLVAFSRMYLGVHYLSDVLAAVAGGIAWLSLTLMGVRLLGDARHRRSR